MASRATQRALAGIDAVPGCTTISGNPVSPHIVFSLATALSLVLTVSAAAFFRGRFFAAFLGVILTVQGLIAAGVFPHSGGLWPLFAVLQATVHLHFASLSRPRMRPLAWRALVSIPGLFFAAGTMLALPVLPVVALGAPAWLLGLPFAIAALGLVQSLWTREEVVELPLDGTPLDGARPQRHRPGPAKRDRPLHIVQITDPHLGPLMSVRRLRRICERAVERSPDLILLTGDFLTMESQVDPAVLEDALAPLTGLPGRVFACFGNHDHEAPHVVRRALSSANVHLLMDEEAVVDTPAGPVQVVGIDFVFRRRDEHVRRVCERYPRRTGHLRVVLLHDPGAFRHVPDGLGDLVLSGHTHGGQLGFLSLGLPWTFVSFFTSIPDHGLWARGRNRLYVHRGTGVYGFPLRVGVPAEQSLVRVHVARDLP